MAHNSQSSATLKPFKAPNHRNETAEWFRHIRHNGESQLDDRNSLANIYSIVYPHRDDSGRADEVLASDVGGTYRLAMFRHTGGVAFDGFLADLDKDIAAYVSPVPNEREVMEEMVVRGPILADKDQVKMDLSVLAGVLRSVHKND